MHTLKEVIWGFIKENPELSKQVLVNLDDYWKNAMGEVIASVSYPDYLKDNKLVVIVKNAVWLSQLKLMKMDILEKLKRNDSITIDDIEFKIEKKKRRSDTSNKKQQEMRSNKIVIDPEIEDKINKSLEIIKDEEIKKLLKSIFVKSYYLK
jgi:hypothetical protein